MRLKNKIVLVTGASGLLGRAILKLINFEGGIAISADINNEHKIDNSLYQLDVTDKKSIDTIVDNIFIKFGKLDGLVNAAYPRTDDWGNKFEDIKIESWKANIDFQLNSTFTICQAVLKRMKENRNGSIVNLASIYGVVGPDFSIYEGTEMTMPAAYSAVKGGIVNFTRYLASYYGQYNIRINCVSPGGIFNNQDESFVKLYESKVPLRRMGRPEDIAPAVCFLLSNESSYITGHNLLIDGGWTAI
jgi:NAD(P)-dependent dehydrogenase (short-subunit alcohol dehydrogenase family)